MEKQQLVINGVVVFIDAHRMEHNALVTCIHGTPEGDEIPEVKDDDGKVIQAAGFRWPCINLVIVSPNGDCQDQYGRQLERHTSVVHQAESSAQGYCFRFPDETLDPEMRKPTVS